MEKEREREEKMKAQMKKCNAERLMIRRTISSDATTAATAAVGMKLKKSLYSDLNVLIWIYAQSYNTFHPTHSFSFVVWFSF